MFSLDPSALPSLLPFCTQAFSHIPPAHHPALRELSLFFNTPLSSPTTRTISDYIASHPIETTILLLSPLIISNPLSIASFIGHGVAARSTAAALQSTMDGHVASGSLFSVLQSIGTQHALAIPMTGGAGLVAMIAKLAVEELLKETAKTSAGELGKCDLARMYSMVNGAVQEWEKVGGAEEAARIAVEKAVEELLGLDAGKIYQNAANIDVGKLYQTAANIDVGKLYQNATNMGVGTLYQNAANIAAGGYECMSGVETVKGVVVGAVGAGATARNWAAGTFGGLFLKARNVEKV